jgi:cytochrome c oxidase assembly factor CtaG
VNISWWCSAKGVPWTWAPRAYPGIWLVMLAIAAAYWVAIRRRRARAAPGEVVATPHQVASFLGGVAALWVSLDWPIGAVGAGYLLSAHMFTYVIVIFVVGPLMETGMPGWMREALFAPRAMAPLRAIVRRPAMAFLFFNVVLVGTHLPPVVDTLKPLQLGAMAIDLLWLVSTLLFWLSTSPTGATGRTDVVYGRRMLYILGVKLTPILLGAVLVLAEFPLYRTYELAPRITDLSAMGDQVLAGWIMWMGATPLLIWRLGEAFFTWYALENPHGGAT